MSSDRQLNYVNDLQNRDQKLYYVDDASELNSINLKENDKIYAINDNKLFQMEIVDQEEELSGSIISFNGRNNTKIKSLVANIEPVQNLHGYDNPWPAGGGENKWNPDTTKYEAWDTTNYMIDSDYIPVPAGTSAITIGYAQLPSEKVQYLSIVLYDENKSIIQTINRNNNKSTRLDITGFSNVSYVIGKCRSWQMGFQYAYLAFDQPVNTFNFKPYSNICPIGGWTKASIYNEETYDASATPKLTINWQDEAGTIYSGTVTLDEDGSADMVSDMGLDTKSSSDIALRILNNGSSGYNVYRLRMPVEYGKVLISNQYKQYPSVNDAIAAGGGIAIGNRTGSNLYISVVFPWVSGDTNETADARLLANMLQIGYTLATAKSWHFANIGQLQSFLGTNNVWSDIGDITVKIAEKGITAFELEPYI